MTDNAETMGEGLFPKSAGERLAAARKAANLDLGDIASRTRVPLRQLEAIESGRYDDLPSVTYATGFAKAFARQVGVDEAEIAALVRAELESRGRGGYSQPEYFEPADPARVPSRTLVWTALALLLLVAGGYALIRSGILSGRDARTPTTETVDTGDGSDQNQTAPANGQQPAPSASGQVVLTATQEVWVRIYDAGGKRLYENTMKPGDSYAVPQDANNPMINVGRPEALTVTVGGQQVAPLGEPQHAIKDVGISAQALAARTAPAAGAASNGAASNASTPAPAE